MVRAFKVEQGPMSKTKAPKVVVLGGNFAGLGAAQKIREYAKDKVDITVIARKAYRLLAERSG